LSDNNRLLFTGLFHATVDKAGVVAVEPVIQINQSINQSIHQTQINCKSINESIKPGLAGFCRKVEKKHFSVVKTRLAKIVFARIVIKVNFCCAMFFLCTYSEPVVYVFLHGNLW